MSDATVCLLILAGTVTLFVWNRLSVGVVALLTALALYVTGLLDAEAVVSGFGDPVVIFIATLFVVSEGLDATGVTTWVGQAITKREGTGRTTALAILMVLAALVSAVISPNGAAAALLPIAIVLARRVGEQPSRLLMPLAFAASAGALLTLSGSTVNIIVSDASRDAGAGGFGFFEFAIMGVPLVAATMLVSLLTGQRLLPQRTSTAVPPDFSAHTATLLNHYALNQGFFRLHVAAQSPLVDRIPSTIRDEVKPAIILIGHYDQHGHAAHESQQIQTGDTLVLTGLAGEIRSFADQQQLIIAATPLTKQTPQRLVNREMGVAEIVIPPRSPLLGETVMPGLTWPHDTIILGIQRLGNDCGPRPVVLAEGDMLLVHGPWASIDELTRHRDLLLADSPEMIRRQSVPLGQNATLAIAITVGMITLLATGLAPPAIAGLAAAIAMVLFGVVGVQHAYRAISWQTVVLLGGLIPLSHAIQTSGAADRIADLIVDIVGSQGPYVLLIVLFALTASLGQIISNTATTLIVAPIAVAASIETGVSIQPVLMLIAVAGAASFLTPIATPANMIVMGPGGYRFGDYWKLGSITMVLWLAIALLIIPVVWPF